MMNIIEIPDTPDHRGASTGASRRWIIIFLLLFCAAIFAKPYSANPLKFKKLAQESALTASVIYQVFQDRKGFIWLATQYGLAKYDGYTVTNFTHIPGDTTTISDNTVRAICEDASGNLWIGTSDGLNLLAITPAQQRGQSGHRFIRFRHSPDDSLTLCNSDIRSLAAGADGALWVGTVEGLNRMFSDTLANGEVVHRIQRIHKPAVFANGYITEMVQDHLHKNIMWAGTLGKGLHRIDANDLAVLAFSKNDTTAMPISSDYIISLYQSPEGLLWIGTYRGGLNVFDPQTGHSVQYRFDENDPNSLPDDRIYGIAHDAENRLWIGTFGGGVACLSNPIRELPTGNQSRIDGHFIRYQSNSRDPQALTNDFVRHLMIDRSENMWVSTNRDVNVADLKPPKFLHISQNPFSDNTLGDNNVIAILEDRQKRLWIGHHTGLDMQTPDGVFHNYTIDHRNPRSQGGFVYALAEDRFGYIWIGTFGGGLQRINPSTGDFLYVPHGEKNGHVYPDSRIADLMFDSRKNLWIASPLGLYLLNNQQLADVKLNPESLEFVRFTTDSSEGGMSDNRISTIYEDRNGRIWIGTANGLNRMNPGNTSVDLHIDYVPKNPEKGLSHPGVTSILQDPNDDQVFWLGSENGLNRLRFSGDRVSGVQHYFDREGLPNSFICDILDDTSGNLWITTNKGMLRLNPSDTLMQNIRTYDTGDGLQSGEFTIRSGFRNAAGELFFGGINGFNRFFPDRVQENVHIPSVALTEYKQLGVTVYDALELSRISHIDIPYDARYFEFTFAALDFTYPNGNRFAYFLDGFDKNWSESGTRRFASYTNIGPGKYVFRLKAANSDGVWNEAGLAIPIVIRPPFWQTWWFRLIAVLAILGVLALIYQYRVEKLLELERMRVRIASDLHDDVGSSLTKISLYSDLLREEVDAENRQTLLSRINNLSRELVLTMSDIVWSIDSRNDTIGDLLDRMHDFAMSALSPRQIAVSFDVESLDDAKKLPVDIRQNLYLVFKEAINNVARHSGATEVRVALHNRQGRFTMQVHDNGQGIELAKKSSGHGLRNMQMRANRIGGELTIANSDGTTIQLNTTML